MNTNESIVLTEAEVGDMLQVSSSTVRRWWVAGHLPAPFKLGGHLIRWRKTDIENWFNTIPGHPLSQKEKQSDHEYESAN